MACFCRSRHLIVSLLRQNYGLAVTWHHREQIYYNRSTETEIRASKLSGHSTFTLPPSFNITYRSFATQTRKCWKCGKDTDVDKEMFFCQCGVIQEVDKLNYFQILRLPEEYDVDLESLSNKYKNLQKQLHPDKFSLKSEKEQSLADQQSSYIVSAYQTMLRPLLRALYMLELYGSPVEEDNTSVDQDFLMDIMEINESLIEATEDSEELERIEAENNERIQECVKQVSQAFRNKDIESAKSWTIKLKYFNNIDGKLKELKQLSFDK